jgi:hypothetical protein
MEMWETFQSLRSFQVFHIPTASSYFFYRIEWIDINEKGASGFIVLLKPDSKGFKKNL